MSRKHLRVERLEWMWTVLLGVVVCTVKGRYLVSDVLATVSQVVSSAEDSKKFMSAQWRFGKVSSLLK